MRTKVTLVLLLLNVVLFFFIFRVERRWQTERVAMEVRRQLLGAEAADIRSLEVVSSFAGGSFRVERRGELWFLTKPLEWRANPLAVNRMINDLQFLEHETSFSVDDVLKNGQSLKDYGLDHAKLVVTLTSGGQDTTGGPPVTTRLRIGDATQRDERLYLLSPDGSRIHVVGRELADSLSLPLRQLRADTILTIPVFEARSLNLQAAPPAGVRVLIQRDGNRWWFETPIPARASKEAIDLAVNGLDALRVKRFVNGPAGPAPKDEPVLTATIVGDNRHETLFLGHEVAGAAPTAAGRETYAQLEGLAATFVVSVPPLLFETLRNSQESLRDHHVLPDFDPGTVTVITLQAPGQPELTLQRLEPDAAQPAGPDSAAGPPSDAGWQIVLRGEAGQGPATLPADRTVVRGLLDDLVSLMAQQFKSDAPQASDLENWGFKLPERIVILTLQAPAAGGPSTALAPAPVPAVSEITLEIGRGSQRDAYVYARVPKHSQSIYSVSPDILRQTPMAPSEWRDRMLASLPEAAKIRALKLTEIDNGKVILDWTTEKPAGPAVDAVLEQLRVLRARRFVASVFAPTVKIGGEQRPWKFRLDATVALPTGAGGERTSLRTLWLAERTGGDEQLAGSADFGAVFVLDQPFLDALWTLTYGGRDPGPPPPPTAR